MLFFNTLLLAGAVLRADVASLDGKPKQPSAQPLLRSLLPSAGPQSVASSLLPSNSRPSLISRLRGGEVEAVGRTRRLKVRDDADSSQDPSVVLLSRADAEAMHLANGDYVTLRGRKQRRTTAVVSISKKMGAGGGVKLSATSLHALRLEKGDDVIVAPELDLPEAERVLMLPFEEDLAAFDGTEEDAFAEGLAPYLRDQNRPLTVGDVLDTPIGGQRMRWKVMELEPEALNPLEAPRGTVGASTEIFTDGEPLEHDEDERIGYSDIGGHEKLLETLKELVDLPLRHPSVFEDVGVRPPKGVLLYGPPGSGKTMVAKAVETETGVNFQTVNGPELMAQKSGDAEGALRKIFERAADGAPSVIFIDEIDALAPKRDKTQDDTQRRVVSQLLTLMDNLQPNSRVIVIGATNRPGTLDGALRRFGRFDREVDLGIPDQEGRYAILRKKAKGLRLAPEVDLAQISEDTHGCCGADLSQLLSESAMAAVREHAGEIDVDAEDVDPAVLASIIVKPEHIKASMDKMTPAALRDKAVEIPDTRWEDVGGLEDVKREMTETLTYPLKHAAKYAHYGMSASKGILLYGPSGTGKTLVAKAIANEVKSNFISVKGPELLSMWFGESESNVRELFDKARSAAPCILFFDEIDSIAKPRGSGGAGGGEAGDRIVNQILTEIDGVGSKKSVFVIAATNRPDMIDPALMRPGRLDQLVYLPLPDQDSRVAIFKAATRKSPLAADIKLEELAERTEGFSGADITEICQRACKLAIRQHIAETSDGVAKAQRCAKITKSHFDEAFTYARKSVSEADVKKYTAFRESMKAGTSLLEVASEEGTSFAEMDTNPISALASLLPFPKAAAGQFPSGSLAPRRSSPLSRPLTLRGGKLASRTQTDPDRVARVDRHDVDLTVAEAKPLPYALRIDAVDEKQEGSVALLHPKKMEELGLMDGDTVRLKGKRSHETLCTVRASAKVAEDAVSLAGVTRDNLHKMLGDETKVYRLDNIRTGDRILVEPFEDGTGGLDLEDIHKKVLEPYFHGKKGKAPYRPVMEGDLIRVQLGARLVECKVIAAEPNSRCIVGPETVIEPPDELLEREEDASDIGYEDLGGVTKELAKVRELLELPMRHPRVYTTVGTRPPKGILIHGPSGSGKTSIAKAVAAETGAYFFTVNGPEIKSGQPGETEANLRRAFEQCEKNSPAILFLDEIDAIAPRRDKAQGEAEKRLVTQLISLLDGLQSTSQVVVMAATNRLNTLDPALRRFGRFDLEIGIPVPDQVGREDILRIKTRDMNLSPEIDLKALAQDTQGYCGADLAQLVFEAAMTCVRAKLPQMDLELDAVPKLDFTVTPEHVNDALRKTNPSTLRENAVEVPDVKWEDIGGLEEVKRDLKETVQYPVEHADKFEMFGMNPSKGVLFYGPPGCGKTLLAKAIANECNANFISVKGPELLTMWFGESEANVRDLFDKARQASPCVIFFDEMDSIAKQRGGGGGGASEAGDRVINQILTEIDGVGDRKSVFVIGATNRPDILDSAIMRPGRLDQLIYIPLPDYDSRMSIFQANLRKSPLAEDVDLQALANRTDGFSGADISEVCQRACKFAIREDIERDEAGDNVPKSQTDCDELPDANPGGKLRKRHFDMAMKNARKSVSRSELARYLKFKKDLSGGASVASAASAADAAADAAADDR